MIECALLAYFFDGGGEALVTFNMSHLLRFCICFITRSTYFTSRIVPHILPMSLVWMVGTRDQVHIHYTL
jgi:hypothetical protein